MNLGGHRFIFGSFVPSAIPAGYLGVTAGLVYHRVPGYAQLPSLAGTSTTAAVLETIDVSEVVDFGIYFHDLLTLYGDAYGQARVGANTATLLGTGADYTYGGNVGILVNFLRVDGFLLSARAHVGGLGGQRAGIVTLFQDLSTIAEDALERVLNTPTVDLNAEIIRLNTAFRAATASLLTPFFGYKYGFGLDAALGLGPLLGIQLSASLDVASTTYQPAQFDPELNIAQRLEYSVHTLRPTFGAALHLDFSALHVPVSTLVEYVAVPVILDITGQAAGAPEGSFEHLLAVGAYYAGRGDLQLGVTAFTLFEQTPTLGADAQPSGKPLDVGGRFVFRYIW